jgi:hypothetical protein
MACLAPKPTPGILGSEGSPLHTFADLDTYRPEKLAEQWELYITDKNDATLAKLIDQTNIASPCLHRIISAMTLIPIESCPELEPLLALLLRHIDDYPTTLKLNDFIFLTSSLSGRYSLTPETIRSRILSSLNIEPISFSNLFFLLKEGHITEESQHAFDDAVVLCISSERVNEEQVVNLLYLYEQTPLKTKPLLHNKDVLLFLKSSLTNLETRLVLKIGQIFAGKKILSDDFSSSLIGLTISRSLLPSCALSEFKIAINNLRLLKAQVAFNDMSPEPRNSIITKAVALMHTESDNVEQHFFTLTAIGIQHEQLFAAIRDIIKRTGSAKDKKLIVLAAVLSPVAEHFKDIMEKMHDAVRANLRAFTLYDLIHVTGSFMDAGLPIKTLVNRVIILSNAYFSSLTRKHHVLVLKSLVYAKLCDETFVNNVAQHYISSPTPSDALVLLTLFIHLENRSNKLFFLLIKQVLVNFDSFEPNAVADMLCLLAEKKWWHTSWVHIIHALFEKVKRIDGLPEEVLTKIIESQHTLPPPTE